MNERDRDWYPEGEKAPGVAGGYQEWIPAEGDAPVLPPDDEPPAEDDGVIVEAEGAIPAPTAAERQDAIQQGKPRGPLARMKAAVLGDG